MLPITNLTYAGNSQCMQQGQSKHIMFFFYPYLSCPGLYAQDKGYLGGSNHWACLVKKNSLANVWTFIANIFQSIWAKKKNVKKDQKYLEETGVWWIMSHVNFERADGPHWVNGLVSTVGHHIPLVIKRSFHRLREGNLIFVQNILSFLNFLNQIGFNLFWVPRPNSW